MEEGLQLGLVEMQSVPNFYKKFGYDKFPLT